MFVMVLRTAPINYKCRYFTVPSLIKNIWNNFFIETLLTEPKCQPCRIFGDINCLTKWLCYRTKVFALISAGNVGEQPQKHDEMLQQALRETALSPSKTHQWYSNFINGCASINDDQYTG
jgi:hypothetical protein